MSTPSEKDFDIKTGWPRLLLLFIALLIINVWITTHFSLSQNVQRIIKGVSIAVAAASLIGGFMTKSEKENWASVLRAIIIWFLKWRVLVIFYFVLLILVLFISSVTITPEKEMDIHFSGSSTFSQSRNQKVSKGEPISLPSFIVPWGKTYYLSADGYLPDSVTLYPWNTTPYQFKTESNLFVGVLAPQELFKDISFSIILDGQTIQIQSGGKTSLLIGSESTLSKEQMDELASEIKAKLGTEDDSIVNVIKEGWKNPVHYRPPSPLSNGKQIIIRAQSPMLNSSDTIIITDKDLFYPLFLSP